MANLNVVQLIGRLGKDPEIQYSQNGTAKCRLNIGTDHAWTDKQSGERKAETEWSRVIAWGSLAEHCNQFLAKGRLVYVQGRLKTSSYEDKEKVKRWSTDIIAESVQFLDRPEQGGEPRQSASQERGQPSQQRQGSNRNDSRKDGGKPAQSQPSNDYHAPNYGDGDTDLIPF